MRGMLCLSALTLIFTACGPPAFVTKPPQSSNAPMDSLNVETNPADTNQERLLRQARWHLLRASESRLCDKPALAQNELDASLYLLARMEGDGGLDSAATVLGSQVEDEYLRLLPHLQRFSPDSPLMLLLEGLSEEKIENLPPGATQLVRIHQISQQCDMPVDANAKVAASIRFFQTRGRSTLNTWIRRAGRFRPMILRILRAERVPDDLFYVAMIESGFNPNAYSRARAVGLWQFMDHTGRLQGLRQTHWVDERRDPLKSTHAAARHLRNLYDALRDWRLAIAAYNCGRGRVERAIQRAGTRDFWQLDLPPETESYVPLFMAATAIGHDPELFGFRPPAGDPPLAYEEVQLPRDVPYIDLRVAANILKVTYSRLRQLNPELRQRITPPAAGRQRYRLRVPPGTGGRFLRRYAALPASAKPSLYEYVVQPRDNLSTIAHAFGVGSRLVAEANSITNPNHIFPGQRLFIPAGAGVHVTAAHEKITHVVRAGESLSVIARQNGVQVRDLKSWNRLSSTIIHPGDRLTVWRVRARKTEARPSSSRKPGVQVNQDGTQRHIVAPGETLWELSRLFSVSVAQIQKWNGLSSTLIRPGQQLVLSAPNADNDARVYTVIKGDTLYSIARRFGLHVKDLARHNNMSPATALLAGTRLHIAAPTSRLTADGE